MSDKVLVLNQDYSAISICSVSKAFLLVYLNKAEVLECSPSKALRTVNSSFPFPAVIRLYKYVHLPYRGVILTRHNIFKRDRYSCQYCGDRDDLTLDHVMPKSRGGKSNWDNLITACKKCNSRKGDFTPEEADMPLLSMPYKPTFLMFIRDFSSNLEKSWLPFLGTKEAMY
jgi:hypothetical protein